MEIPVFDLSLPKLLILAVIALAVFGPNELPKFAAQAGRAARDLRRIAEGAKTDLREGLGPEFSDFDLDLDDLNPTGLAKNTCSATQIQTTGRNERQQHDPRRHEGWRESSL
jgi:Sec-independent protein translocase protein TatA